jgi:hypothetical protein
MLTCLKTTNKPQKTLTIKTINNVSSDKSHCLVKMTSKPKKTSISKNDQQCIKLCQLIMWYTCLHCTYVPSLPQEPTNIVIKQTHEHRRKLPIMTSYCLSLEKILYIHPYPCGGTSTTWKIVHWRNKMPTSQLLVCYCAILKMKGRFTFLPPQIVGQQLASNGLTRLWQLTISTW